MTQNEQRIAGITETEFTQKNQEHAGRLEIVSASTSKGDIDAILRPLSRAEYDKFQQDVQKATQRGESRSVVLANVVRQCLIAPSQAEFDRSVESYPAVVELFAAELLAMAGADAEVKKKSFR